MRLSHTPLHRFLGSADLSSLLALGLCKDREQDDPPAWGDSIGDTNLTSLQVEAQFAELSIQLAGARLIQEGPEFAKAVNVEPHAVSLDAVGGDDQVPDLRFELHRPPHSTDAIPCQDPIVPRLRGVLSQDRRSGANATKLPAEFGDCVRARKNSARKKLLDSLVRQPEHFGRITHREMSVLD